MNTINSGLFPKLGVLSVIILLTFNISRSSGNNHNNGALKDGGKYGFYPVNSHIITYNLSIKIFARYYQSNDMFCTHKIPFLIEN